MKFTYWAHIKSERGCLVRTDENNNMWVLSSISGIWLKTKVFVPIIEKNFLWINKKTSSFQYKKISKKEAFLRAL